MRKLFPLKNYKLNIPELPHPGAFGAIRKNDIHTGIDLYCNPGASVLCIEKGVVLSIIPFTGPHAGLPWWNDTWAVLIKGESGVILYGEIDPNKKIKVGDMLESGIEIGTVLTVLKKDKNKPMTMLHIELYNKEVKDGVIWNLQEPKPDDLEDPTLLLKSFKF